MLVTGQVYTTTFTIPGQATQPTSVTLVITKPDGTQVTPAVGPGAEVNGDWVVSYAYPLPGPGLYRFAWSSTGPQSASLPDYQNVRDFISIISMDEARNHLNKTSTASDDEIAAFLMAATELVENKAGICVPREFTDRVVPGSPWPYELAVPNKPVLAAVSVKSIWAGGPSWTDPGDGSLLGVDSDAGIIYQPAGLRFWWGPFDVVTRCGRLVIAERLIHAAKEQLRHLWETQRGGQPPALLQGEEEFTTTTGFTFSVPRRVLELLEQDMVPSI